MKVSLEQILEARDRRQDTRRRLKEEYALPVVVLTVNMPGEEKSNDTADFLFETGVEALCDEFLGEIVNFSIVDALTGKEGFFVLNCDDANDVKRRTCRIEDGHQLGRLWDVDVYDKDGKQIGRQELGFPSRKCLICDRPAHECARAKTHSISELTAKIRAMKESFEPNCD